MNQILLFNFVTIKCAFILFTLFHLRFFLLQFLLPTISSIPSSYHSFFKTLFPQNKFSYDSRNKMSTSQQIPSNDSIYGIQVYRTFVPVCSLSTLQAFIPFLYIIPTVIVMITILIKYKIAKATTNTIMDRNIFAFIMFYFLFVSSYMYWILCEQSIFQNTLFFVGDYAHLNLPSAGFITSWCVDVKPNRLFSLIITYTHASSYGVLICPFMICLMRLTIMMSPRHHERVPKSSTDLPIYIIFSVLSAYYVQICYSIFVSCPICFIHIQYNWRWILQTIRWTIQFWIFDSFWRRAICKN